MKRSILLAIVSLAGVLASSTALGAVECLDYATYLHWSGAVGTPGVANGVALAGNFAYVADGYSGLQVVDISNPASPVLVGSEETEGFASGVALSGNVALVADGESGLLVFDISNPTVPHLISSFDTPGYAFGIDVTEDTAVVADGSAGLLAIDISDPKSPAMLTSFGTGDIATAVTIAGGLVFVANAESGLMIVDLFQSAFPLIWEASIDTPGRARGVAVVGTHVLVADDAGGLQVIDVSTPRTPRVVTTIGLPHAAYAVAVAGTVAYVGTTDYEQDLGSITVIDVTSPTPRWSWGAPICLTASAGWRQVRRRPT